jgi:hypothetical protein
VDHGDESREHKTRIAEQIGCAENPRQRGCARLYRNACSRLTAGCLRASRERLGASGQQLWLIVPLLWSEPSSSASLLRHCLLSD